MNEAQKHAENLRDLLPHNDYWGEDDHKIAAAADYIESLTRERNEWRRRWHVTYDREGRFRDERDELRRILNEAPHERACEFFMRAARPDDAPPSVCSCWKSRVPGPQA